jgi:hypothetical protein
MSKVASDQTSDEMVRDSAGGPGFPIQGKRDWPEARTINCALALRRNSKYKHSIFFFLLYRIIRRFGWNFTQTRRLVCRYLCAGSPLALELEFEYEAFPCSSGDRQLRYQPQ